MTTALALALALPSTAAHAEDREDHHQVSVRGAAADDQFDDDETEQVHELVDEFEQQLAELRAALPARPKRAR